jgi:hypothetical protein
MPNYIVRFKEGLIATYIRCQGFETAGQAVDYAVRKSGINEKYLDGVEVQEEAAATPEPTSPTESSRVKFKLDNGREIEAYLRKYGYYITMAVGNYNVFSLHSSGLGCRIDGVYESGIQTDANGRIKLKE